MSAYFHYLGKQCIIHSNYNLPWLLLCFFPLLQFMLLVFVGVVLMWTYLSFLQCSLIKTSPEPFAHASSWAALPHQAQSIYAMPDVVSDHLFCVPGFRFYPKPHLQRFVWNLFFKSLHSLSLDVLDSSLDLREHLSNNMDITSMLNSLSTQI